MFGIVAHAATKEGERFLWRIHPIRRVHASFHPTTKDKGSREPDSHDTKPIGIHLSDPCYSPACTCLRHETGQSKRAEDWRRLGGSQGYWRKKRLASSVRHSWLQLLRLQDAAKPPTVMLS